MRRAYQGAPRGVAAISVLGRSQAVAMICATDMVALKLPPAPRPAERLRTAENGHFDFPRLEPGSFSTPAV